MLYRVLNTGFVLLLLSFFSLPAVHAQGGSGASPGLFRGGVEVGLQELSAVGQERLETLKQDAPTQSIRLVRMVDSLSQQRALVMQMSSQVLAPDIRRRL